MGSEPIGTLDVVEEPLSRFADWGPDSVTITCHASQTESPALGGQPTPASPQAANPLDALVAQRLSPPQQPISTADMMSLRNNATSQDRYHAPLDVPVVEHEVTADEMHRMMVEITLGQQPPANEPASRARVRAQLTDEIAAIKKQKRGAVYIPFELPEPAS